MLNYLQKYNDLPRELKDKVSSQEIMDNIAKLEEKYNISLATVIMRIMVKDISVADLPKFFVFEHSLDGAQANILTEDLKEKVFYLVNDYLDFKLKLEEIGSNTEVDRNVKSANNVHSSSFFFSTEDEEEVKELTEKLKDFDIKDFNPVGNDSQDKKESSGLKIDHDDQVGRQRLSKNTESDQEISEPKKQERILTPEEQAQSIMSDLDINFSSSDLQKRFKKVIETYIRGVRNRIDTKQTIIKSVDSGGLGMDAGVADRILAAVKNVQDSEVKKNIVRKPAKVDLPEDKNFDNEGKNSDKIEGLKKVNNGDVDYDFNALAKKSSNIAKKNDKIEQENNKNNSDVSDNSKEMVLDLNNAQSEVGDLIKGLENDSKLDNKKAQDKEKISTIDLKDEPKKLKDDANVEVFDKAQNLKKESEKVILKDAKDGDSEVNNQKEASSKVNVATIRQHSSRDDKIRMDDVKYVPKLMGPIDELADMSLINFRRLGNNPKEMAAKIEEKIVLLEEDGYDKRIKGIKAWRNSPVNRMYINIGKEAIQKREGIDKIIIEQQEENQESLTIQEFTAIMDLNKKIRF